MTLLESLTELTDDSDVVLYECRICGVKFSEDVDECRECGFEEVAYYEW
ncbi:hypothetical protein [Natronococcus pandeyae]|nr:hypothetical protein [Natronococcus pandeyae]